VSHTGNCLCGAVCYRINGDLDPIQLCHCTQCRKAQGGAFAANIAVDTKHFEIYSGRELLKEFASTTRDGKVRVFCSVCGSPVFSRLQSLPSVVRVRVGLINEPVETGVLHHQFMQDQANWFSIDDDVIKYSGLPTKQ